MKTVERLLLCHRHATSGPRWLGRAGSQNAGSLVPCEWRLSVGWEVDENPSETSLELPVPPGSLKFLLTSQLHFTPKHQSCIRTQLWKQRRARVSCDSCLFSNLCLVPGAPQTILRNSPLFAPHLHMNVPPTRIFFLPLRFMNLPVCCCPSVNGAIILPAAQVRELNGVTC